MFVLISGYIFLQHHLLWAAKCYVVPGTLNDSVKKHLHMVLLLKILSRENIKDATGIFQIECNMEVKKSLLIPM